MNKGITPLIILGVLVFGGFALLLLATTFPFITTLIEDVIPNADPITAIFLAAIPIILLIIIIFSIKAKLTGESGF